MKSLRTLIAVSALATTVGMVPNANALTYNDDHYVGQISPGTPADEAAEAVYAQYLIDLFNGSETVTSNVSFSGVPTAQNFVVGTGGLMPILPDLGATGTETHLLNSSGSLDTSGTYDVTGVLYIYAYYGNGAPTGGEDGQLWYVGDLNGSVTIPKKALSHVTLYGHVPDGGATLVLLGAGLLAVGALRRRLSE
jgi:hypothetical protein